MVVDELTLERVARERRFNARTVEITRRLFIDKHPPLSVAKEFALLDKRIYAIRAAVIKQVQGYALPEGWVEVTLRGPADVVKKAEESFRRRMRERMDEQEAHPSAASSRA